MHQYTAVIERCVETGLYVGHIPGFVGAHSQGATLDELHVNLKEVIEMLLGSKNHLHNVPRLFVRVTLPIHKFCFQIELIGERRNFLPPTMHNHNFNSDLAKQRYILRHHLLQSLFLHRRSARQDQPLP